jgi:hypothetical protein
VVVADFGVAALETRRVTSRLGGTRHLNIAEDPP